ncbi:MAG: phosphoglycerate mutase family protein, partial [Alphaproteobacteria bacterium]
MILLRHGESEFNVVYRATRIDPGIRDPRLTETGRRQAADAARALDGRRLQRLVTSPYTRALETATIVAEALDLPVTIEPLVRERRVFACDIGTQRSRLADRWPAFS